MIAIRRILVALFVSALLCNVSRGQPVDPASPNIVFIFSDDHANKAISAYGSPYIKTPNIDRIAVEGMRFDRCLVTNSICGPSRAVILTGKYSHLNGFRQNGNRFDGGQQTFPKLLRAAGYQTALFGKWHLESEPTGFDDWGILNGQGEYDHPDWITASGKQQLQGYVSDVITDQAIHWLENKRSADQPFMLMVQHKAPHREWRPGPDHLDDFRNAGFVEPETLFDDYSGRSAVVAEQEMTIARHMRDGWDLKLWTVSDRDKAPWKNFHSRMSDEERARFEDAYREENESYLANRDNMSEADQVRWKFRRYLADYLRCIQSVDDNVGRLLDWLEKSGLAENTVVIYSSDQGFYLGEHGWYDKRWIFEESLRTPLLVRWPGKTLAASDCARIVSNLDFAPTFLELAGVQIPEDMQGSSLVPLLRGEQVPDWRDAFYYHYYELDTHRVAGHYGIVTDRYKLVHYNRRLGQDGKPESIDQRDLFDLQVDPNEVKSFYGDPAYEEVRQQLSSRLQALREKLQVPDGE